MTQHSARPRGWQRLTLSSTSDHLRCTWLLRCTSLPWHHRDTLTRAPADSFGYLLRWLPARDKRGKPTLVKLGSMNEPAAWHQSLQEQTEPRVVRLGGTDPSTSFGFANMLNREPKRHSTRLTFRTFSHTAQRPSFSLPVGYLPTVVPEAGEARFLPGTEPRQVDKRADLQQNSFRPKVLPRLASATTHIL